jgi:hypothetical protein
LGCQIISRKTSSGDGRGDSGGEDLSTGGGSRVTGQTVVLDGNDSVDGVRDGGRVESLGGTCVVTDSS